MDLHYEAAQAIVVAYRHFNKDPLKFKHDGGQPRYYAFRILWEYARYKNVQVPAPLLARYVGYKFNTSLIMGAPSIEKQQKFDRQTLLYLVKIFNDKLQNRASNQAVTEITQETDLPVLPKLDKDQVRLKPLSLRTKIEDLPRYVSTAIPVNTRRKTLEEELRQAILNTGGRLAGDDNG